MAGLREGKVPQKITLSQFTFSNLALRPLGAKSLSMTACLMMSGMHRVAVPTGVMVQSQEHGDKHAGARECDHPFEQAASGQNTEPAQTGQQDAQDDRCD